jgi:hypothetical protein
MDGLIAFFYGVWDTEQMPYLEEVLCLLCSVERRWACEEMARQMETSFQNIRHM